MPSSSLKSSHGNEAKNEEHSMELGDENYKSFGKNLVENSDKVEKRKYFSEVYELWLKTRKETLEKLRTLLNKLHDDQLSYNKIQMTCRKTGRFARQVKSGAQSRPLDFLACFAAVLSDSSCGITSFAQAMNIEAYLSQFQEITDQDAKMTKQLYDARSLCFVEYSDIEEVFRKYQSYTLNSAVAKVSTALGVDKFLSEFEHAFQKDDWNKVANIMQSFVEKSSQSNVVHDVNDSVCSYFCSNPAASDALKAFGRAVYGTFDGLGIAGNQEIGNQSVHTNEFLINQDEIEISQLQSTVERKVAQSKLEEKILDALDSLTDEMNEVNEAYLQLLGSDSDSGNSFND